MTRSLALCLCLSACDGGAASSDGSAAGLPDPGSACAGFDAVRFSSVAASPPACTAEPGEVPECVAWARSLGLAFVPATSCSPGEGGFHCRIQPAVSTSVPVLCRYEKDETVHDPVCVAIFEQYVLGAGTVRSAGCLGTGPVGSDNQECVIPLRCPVPCAFVAPLPDGGLAPWMCVARNGAPACEPFCNAP